MENFKEKKLPLVSILIPTHERPHLLSLALASAVSQTYGNIEVIVSDNSMDNDTEAVVANFKQLYPNIKYFHTPGLDMEGNWQKCWDNMSPESEYVNFLMDDDIFAPNKIEMMMDYCIQNPELALVTSYRKLIDKDGNPMPDRYFNQPIVDDNSVISGESAGKQLLVTCTNWIGEPTTVLFKREYAGNYFRGWSGDEKYLILDYPLWLRVLEKGDMVYIVTPLSFFRLHGENDTYDQNTVIKGASSMALMIQHAWNHKMFLTEERDIRDSLYAWIMSFTGATKLCFDKDVDTQESRDLKVIYKEISSKFVEDHVGKIEFDI